jgi:hypothetical protein
MAEEEAEPFLTQMPKFSSVSWRVLSLSGILSGAIPQKLLSGKLE